MYDENKKFSKRHWYGILFLMVVLGILALRQSIRSEDAAQPPETPEAVYPEFGMMFDADGNPGPVFDGTISGIINGRFVSRMSVSYNLANGYAVHQGDILLNPDGPVQAGLGINTASQIWPDDLVPYEIDSRLPDQQRIHDAIAHWEEYTSMRFVERTKANASQYANYVKFVPSQGCASYVGMQGGMQPIMLASACSTGNTIHEIGHAVGLWHEQSRNDRDDHVDVRYENIISVYAHNFDKQTDNGVDLGDYDYGSIMHYPRWAFSRNGKDTIVPHGDQEIGQRDGLSPGDIGAVETIYDSSDVAADTGHQLNSAAFAYGCSGGH